MEPTDALREIARAIDAFPDDPRLSHFQALLMSIRRICRAALASPVPVDEALVRLGLERVAHDYGQKGGKARAQHLTPERRREIARQAVTARWKKYRERQVS
jgi:hypothetical protein